MTAHELARRLLDGPDVPVATDGMGGSMYAVKELKPVKATTDDGWSYYEFDPQHLGGKRAVEIIRLW